MILRQSKKSFANKVCFLCIFLFSITCLCVCAETKQSPANAQLDRDAVVELAKSLVGKPYKYGAVGPSSFDCSGFVYYTYRTAIKKQLPRTATAIYNSATVIRKDELEPGDLVFFKTTSSGNVSHVGIYIGDGKFVSAISDGYDTGVVIRSLTDKYWKNKYCGSGRILPAGIESQKEDKSPFEEDDLEISVEKKNEERKTVTSKQNISSKKKNSDSFAGCLMDGCTFNTDCCFGSLLCP